METGQSIAHYFRLPEQLGIDQSDPGAVLLAIKDELKSFKCS